MRFGFLSTYPPTRCGLATFTEALAAAMVDGSRDEARIVRVLDDPAPAGEARFGSRPIAAELVAGDSASIAASIRALNGLDIAVVQHEYGIFGGVDGDEVIGVLEGLTVPSIVVLHTVLDAPSPGQRSVLERVADVATSIVVMTDAARAILDRRFDVDMAKVAVIPHGVASALGTLPHADSSGRTVVTWGLIGPGKGLEWGIRAMAELADMRPQPEYLVVGRTHPKVLASEGEAYRERLAALIDELGLGDRVHLVDEYPDADALAAYIARADLVLLPYDSRNQVTSGVLVEAVAAGSELSWADVASRYLDLAGGILAEVAA
jgi:polysaccharide biosynthesis protein PslF